MSKKTWVSCKEKAWEEKSEQEEAKEVKYDQGGRKMQNPHRIFSPFAKLIYNYLLVKVSDTTIDQCNVKFGSATI